MTNVKLKLMFYLLNALLTADIVQARPYSDNRNTTNTNSTDIVLNFNSNETYIPVDPNSDTLIVATEEEMNQRSNNAMDSLMTAERDRDEDLSKKVMKKPDDIPEDPEGAKEPNHHLDAIITSEHNRDVKLSEKENSARLVQGMPKVDVDYIDKPLNISSSLLDKIINSETNREETLTDILFRPESELIETPKFEFLIATKVNESEAKSESVKRGNSIDRNSSDVLKKVEYVELVEVLKPLGENKSAYNLLNITANELDNDLAPDTSFTDMQTLFLACFGTLLPLLTILCATLLIRSMCRRWCPGCCRKKADISESESSDKDDNNEIKSPLDDSGGGEVTENGEGHPSNGSIFTMTLKNNHLIVETEERNDITRNGRETKMKYSPDNEGIFVVEVQQSTAYRPNNKPLQNSPPLDPQISTNQALIHRVPEELEKKLEEDSEKSSTKFDKDKALALSSTGLSISDLSMSSIGSHNVSYSYSSQMGYEQGPFGYPIYAGYDTKDESEGIIHDNSQEPLISKTPTDPYKPVVTAAIFKQDSIISNDVLQGPGYCIEGSSDGPLLSDVQAREASLQHLQNKKIENGVAVQILEKIESPKNPLNRADSLPVRLEEQNVTTTAVIEKNQCMEAIQEYEFDDVAKDHLKGKRASLPLIRTEVYESMKDAIRPSGSPKFEKLLNDISPAEGSFDQPPMITITEECEPGKSDNTS